MKYFIGGAVLFIGFIGFKVGLYYKDKVWKRRIKKAIKKVNGEETIEEGLKRIEALLLDNGKEVDL